MIKITVPPEKLRLSKGSNKKIHGIVYFSTGNVYFPDDTWDDFVVIILGWWIQSLRNLLRGVDNKVTLRFMDGPFLLEVSKQDNQDTFEVVFLRGASTSLSIIYKETILPEELLENMIGVANETILRCQESFWETDDLEKLKKIVLDI